MKLCAEILVRYLTNPEHEPFLVQLEQAIDRYGITDLMVHGWNLSSWIRFEAFPEAAQRPDPAAIDHLRAQLRRFSDRGVRICLSGSEPRLPPGFLEAYPEVRHLGNGLLWKFYETSTAEALRTFPEVERYELYLWETPLMNDRDFFREFYWAPTVQQTAIGADRHLSPADCIANVISACARGGAAVGKELVVLTFAHYAWQERLLIDALHKVDRRLPITLDHKCQPGDWTPHRPANNVMLEVTDRPAMMLFDGAGEYWGQCFTPYCYPQEIQQRLWHAMKHNPSIDTLNMRVVWTHGHLFDTPNEVNLYALSRLARDPQTPIEDIWSDWASDRYGASAAPYVISALRRSNRIANLVYYIRGVWVHNHSAISDLPYLESHVLNYSRAQIEYTPWDFETQALLTELVENPREYTIEWVLADRQEALRLNALSSTDLDAARPHLLGKDYDQLHGQLALQRAVIKVAIPHIEAFLRYRIDKHSPTAANLERLAEVLNRLDRLAGEIESVYAEQFAVLSADDIRTYVRQVREAVAGPREAVEQATPVGGI